mmetsp:Transcript_112315/g.349976  ORF Transcript_112315/g.349976 Transcript_112315/m.349976 type:complete len:219 (-) Transcript_112315:1700-2356(-)
MSGKNFDRSSESIGRKVFETVYIFLQYSGFLSSSTLAAQSPKMSSPSSVEAKKLVSCRLPLSSYLFLQYRMWQQPISVPLSCLCSWTLCMGFQTKSLSLMPSIRAWKSQIRTWPSPAIVRKYFTVASRETSHFATRPRFSISSSAGRKSIPRTAFLWDSSIIEICLCGTAGVVELFSSSAPPPLDFSRRAYPRSASESFHTASCPLLIPPMRYFSSLG